MDYYPFSTVDKEITIKRDNTVGTVDAKFRASLYKPFNRTLHPLKLTISLRIDLRQAQPKTFFYNDSDGVVHFATRWTQDDWRSFISLLQEQADRWNNRLWLKPPPLFGDYDFVDPRPPGGVWRSNIACELEVDWEAKKNPHNIVTAVQLDDVLEAVINNRTFREDSSLFSSDSIFPRRQILNSDDFKQIWQAVVTHELGHMMGVGHIGVLMDLPRCKLARFLASEGFNLLTDSRLRGGSGSSVCYGFDEPEAISRDIMGLGGKVTTNDAIPWTRAMSELSPKSGLPGSWTPVTKNPGPGVWLIR